MISSFFWTIQSIKSTILWVTNDHCMPVCFYYHRHFKESQRSLRNFLAHFALSSSIFQIILLCSKTIISLLSHHLSPLHSFLVMLIALISCRFNGQLIYIQFIYSNHVVYISIALCNKLLHSAIAI
jgi:hypothetical protein